jgi:hypothetical protein
MFRVHTEAPVAMPFPAAEVDQPGGGELDTAIGLGILRQARKPAGQFLCRLGRQYRVLEKTSGIVHPGRVGQLAAADVHHRIEHRLGRRFTAAALFKFPCQCRVSCLHPRTAGQLQVDCGYHQLVLQAVLENAVAVAELARCSRDDTGLAARYRHTVHPLDEGCQLDTVGADILDRRGAHGSRNQGEVFQAEIALLQ